MSVHEERVKRIATAFNADSGNARLQLGDAIGATQFSTFDSNGNETFIVKSDGTINVTGDATFDSQGIFSGNVLPSSGNSYSLGTETAPWSEIYGSDLHVGNLVAENKIATIGGRIVVSPSTKLIANVTLAATTIDVQHNSLSSGDRIYLESVGKFEWMAVTSGPTTITGGYRYSVTRNLNGGSAQAWASGDAVINTGTTGQGFIDLYSRYGIPAAGQTSTARRGPTIVGNVRTGTNWDAMRERWAVGNLQGLFDYGSSVYGFAAGDPTAAWISADATNGIRLMNGSTNLGQWTAAGGITIGEVASLKSNVLISSGALIIRNNLTERVKLTSNGVLTINDSGGNAVFTFDSSAGAEFTKPLTLGSAGGIYQGTGTFAAPTTGLKIWNDSGVGRIAGYTSGLLQWYAGTDGKLYAGGGEAVIDNGGVYFTVGYGLPGASNPGSSGGTVGEFGYVAGSAIKWGTPASPKSSIFTSYTNANGNTLYAISGTGEEFTKATVQIYARGGNTNGGGVISLNAIGGGNTASLSLYSNLGAALTGNMSISGDLTLSKPNSTTTLQASATTGTPVLTLPSSSGTVALTSDVTSAVTGTSGKLTKFTGVNTVGNSIVSESGSTIAIAGNMTLAGSTSGVATVQAAAVAGMPVLTLPTSSGTLALTSEIISGASLTSGTLPKVTGTNAIGDSLVSESSSTVTINGNIAVSGTARRIIGDFSAATHANRTLLQNSQAGDAQVGIVPKSGSTGAYLIAYSQPDPDNSGYVSIGTSTNYGYVISNKLGTGTTLPLMFQMAGSEAARFTINRALLVNRASATLLSDAAGNLETAGSIGASTSFVAGSVAAPGSPADGEHWNDSTQKAYIAQLAGVKQTLVGTIFTATASKTCANTTGETSLIGTGVGTLTLPANFWTVGKTIRVTAVGYWSQASTGSGTQNRTMRAYLGSTKIAEKQLTSMDTNVQVDPWVGVAMNVIATCRTTGSSGTIYAQINGNFDDREWRQHSFYGSPTTAAVTINTTTSAAIDMRWSWGTANSNNSITITNVIVEVLN